jgi:hypothetical protein
MQEQSEIGGRIREVKSVPVESLIELRPQSLRERRNREKRGRQRLREERVVEVT